jgi:Cu(I)/Ag(I) efflux system membrane protein CusA/SilA
MTPEKLVEELDRAVKIPGLSNIWIPPIRNRIDMLATGIKSPIGVKVTGNDLGVIDRIAAEVEQVAKGIPGVTSSLAERLTGGRYVDVQIDRGRRSLRPEHRRCPGGRRRRGGWRKRVGNGRGAGPLSHQSALRARMADSPQRLAELPIFTPMGQQITLGTVARIAITDGPPMLKSENAARPVGSMSMCAAAIWPRWPTNCAMRLAAGQAGAGVSIAYSGQFEYMERANARLKVVVPATLLIIFVCCT